MMTQTRRAKDPLSVKARSVLTLSMCCDHEYQCGPMYGAYHALRNAALSFDSPAHHIRYRALGALDGAYDLLDVLIDEEEPESTPEEVKAHALCALALNIFAAKSAAQRDESIAQAEQMCREEWGVEVELRKGIDGFRRAETSTT